MTESEQIDDLLNRTQNQDWLAFHSSMPDWERTMLHKAVGLGLLVSRGRTFDLTEKGHEVIDAGGYDKWKAETTKRSNEIHKATLDSSKATVDASAYAKQSRNAAWVASVAAVMAFCYGVYQGAQSTEQDKRINALEKQINTLGLQLKAPSQTPKAITAAPQSQKKK